MLRFLFGNVISFAFGQTENFIFFLTRYYLDYSSKSIESENVLTIKANLFCKVISNYKKLGKEMKQKIVGRKDYENAIVLLENYFVYKSEIEI